MKATVLALALVAACPITASAIDQATAWARIKLAIACTDAKTCTNQEESTKIWEAGNEMIKEEKDANKKPRGTGGINGTYPDATTGIRVETLQPGLLTIVSFIWADPTNNLQPTSGPDVASVHYEYSHTLDAGTFVPLGISTDASSNFALTYTSFPVEEAIIGRPYDASGNPIFIADIDGSSNIAVSTVVNLLPDAVPESSTKILLCTGVFGPLFAAKSRTRCYKFRPLR